MLELYLNRCPLADLCVIVESSTGEPICLEVIDHTERLAVGSVHNAVLTTKAPHLSGYFLQLEDGTSVFAPRKYFRNELQNGDRLRVVIRKPERQGKRATVSPVTPEEEDRDSEDRLRVLLKEWVDKFKPKRVHLEDRLQQRLFSPEHRETLLFEIKSGLRVDWSRFMARRKGQDLEIVVDETEAFTMIDVNSAFLRSGAYAVNQKAAKLVLHEILTTKIRGVILVDFIDLEPDLRPVFLDELKRSGYGRENEIVVHGFTSLGILELTRPKSERSLREIFRDRSFYQAIRCYYELIARASSGEERLCVTLSEEIYKRFLDAGILAEFTARAEFILAPPVQDYRFDSR